MENQFNFRSAWEKDFNFTPKSSIKFPLLISALHVQMGLENSNFFYRFLIFVIKKLSVIDAISPLQKFKNFLTPKRGKIEIIRIDYLVTPLMDETKLKLFFEFFLFSILFAWRTINFYKRQYLLNGIKIQENKKYHEQGSEHCISFSLYIEEFHLQTFPRISSHLQNKNFLFQFIGFQRKP